MRQPLVLLPALVALGLALAPAKVRADAWPTFAGVKPFDLNFYSQVQVGAAGVLAGGPKPGGMELRAALNVGGIGASAGGRYEPYPSGGGLLGFLDVELR